MEYTRKSACIRFGHIVLNLFIVSGLSAGIRFRTPWGMKNLYNLQNRAFSATRKPDVRAGF
jgi:hypothetical protein